MSRYLKSPCCGEPVVVPVDVTVHLRVTSNSTVSTTLIDSLSGIRHEARTGDYSIREAYCTHCGEPVTT